MNNIILKLFPCVIVANVAIGMENNTVFDIINALMSNKISNIIAEVISVNEFACGSEFSEFEKGSQYFGTKKYVENKEQKYKPEDVTKYFKSRNEELLKKEHLFNQHFDRIYGADKKTCSKIRKAMHAMNVHLQPNTFELALQAVVLYKAKTVVEQGQNFFTANFSDQEISSKKISEYFKAGCRKADSKMVVLKFFLCCEVNPLLKELHKNLQEKNITLNTTSGILQEISEKVGEIFTMFDLSNVSGYANNVVALIDMLK